MNATELPSTDEAEALAEDKGRGPTRWIALAAVLLAGCLAGAAALSDAAANFGDVAKIVGVLAFIFAMLALGIGIVGHASRS